MPGDYTLDPTSPPRVQAFTIPPGDSATFEIEARLIEHVKVLEAAVVGRADEDGLTKPEAYVVLNDRKDASETFSEELREHCRAGLAHYKYPRWCNFVDDLPKTATGKIQRFRLREGS